jgi:hypothetical protein
MIRRGFWLAVGATAGIMGYRRAASLGRSLSGTLMLDGGADSERTSISGAKHPASRKQQVGRGLGRRAIRLTRDFRRFNRDVREGMDLYLVRHRAQGSPTLGAGAQSRRSPAAPLSEFSEVPGAATVNDERVKDDR